MATQPSCWICLDEEPDEAGRPLHYRVKHQFLYKGWITAIKSTESGLHYVVKYEDKDTEELTLEELNDPTSVTLERANGPSMIETKRARRRTACGTCKRCIRMECGKCRQCKDMPIFGGPGKLKERCIKRRCNQIS